MASGHQGRGKRHKTLVLEEGMTWTALGVNHEDSQFIEIAALHRRGDRSRVRRPGHMIGGETKGSMTYSNSETRSLDFLKFCLGPWLAASSPPSTSRASLRSSAASSTSSSCPTRS